MKFSSDDKVSLVNKILAAHSTYHRGSEAVSVFFDSTRTKNTLKLFLKDSSKSACYDLIKRLTQSNGEEANSTLKNSLSTYQF